MSLPFTERSAVELARALRARETTAVAVTEAHLERLAARDGEVHAFATVCREAALADARAADALIASRAHAPLAGVPVAVKDLFAVRGVARRNGSTAFADASPEPHDATVVARLRRAGAVILGTAHMHELALGPTGINSAFGTPANPWAAGRVPGGSSSGSGAAVAARLVPAALGSDTGGSIRLPASFCGISGLKPTYGRVSRAGTTPLAWTLDHVGPMARSVEDLALLLGVLAGHDAADASSARLPVPDYTAALAPPAGPLRVGVLRGFTLASVDGEVERAFTQALADLRAAGATVTEVRLPALAHATPAIGAVILAEANAALRPLLGPRYEQVSVETRVYLALGTLVSAETYLAAQRVRTVLYEEMRAALQRVDVLALPGTPMPAPRIDEFLARLGAGQEGVVEAITRFTVPINLTGLPALVVPCGFTGDGLPLGLQLVGRPFAESELLAAGDRYQRATDWHRRRPPLAGAAE